MASRPNLSDIAKALGVSIATVSNAMSGKGRVSDKLAEQIQKTARDMGYIASSAGRALSTGQSNVLGLVLANIAHPLFPQYAQAIEHAASAAGYGVLIGDSQGSESSQKAALNRLIERGADGIIVVPRHGTTVDDAPCPITLIDAPTTPGNVVSADHLQGGCLMGQHLLDLGHRTVVLLGTNPDSNVQRERIRGLRQALDAVADTRVVWVEEIEAVTGANASLKLEDEVARGVTAVATVSDVQAYRVISELQMAGLSVPGDVSVTGFDDLVWARILSPRLTTVASDMAGIAKIAVAHITERLKAKASSPAHFGAPDLPAGLRMPQTDLTGSQPNGLRSGVTVPMKLVVRESSGPAKSAPRSDRGASGIPSQMTHSCALQR